MAPVDNRRVPPGQRLVNDLPVLHAGSVMRVQPDSWSLTVSGLVRHVTTIDRQQLLALPSTEQTSNLHCVTGWSMLGLEFTADQRLGYWERRGYHALGDPWLEQRYS